MDPSKVEQTEDVEKMFPQSGPVADFNVRG